LTLPAKTGSIVARTKAEMICFDIIFPQYWND
jgi:hypothetical protein